MPCAVLLKSMADNHANDAFGSKADIRHLVGNVRLSLDSGH
jgi:hypothetical protein